MAKLLPPIDEQHKSPKVLSFFILGILCIIINFLVLSYTGTNDQTMIVKISPGANTTEIAKLLEEKGVIQNSFLFRVLARQKGLDSHLKAGHYSFEPHLTMGQVLDRLEKGQNLFLSITIPEGYNLEQIASLLAKKGLVNKQVFLEKAKAANFDFSFLKEAKEKGQSLEGYLFPATYRLEAGWTEERIIETMLKHFVQVVDSEFQKEMQAQGISLHQLVTLASIIEREVKVDKERPLISAVFHNRIEKQMRLQSCATVQYLLKQPKKRLTYEDTRVPSLYNTYLHPGLPPGPIAGPGKASLDAALHPAKVKYLFFVAKGDGTHYFSDSFQDHKTAIAKVRSEKKD